MKEDVEKKEWTTPEIMDLDVEKTAGGLIQNGVESSGGTLS